MSTIDSYGAANLFIQRAIQDWPHHRSEVKIAAVQTVLDMAGFMATATCWPVFGGLWPKPCGGPDGVEASAWLEGLTDGLQPFRGKVEREIEFVKEYLDQRITLQHP